MFFPLPRGVLSRSFPAARASTAWTSSVEQNFHVLNLAHKLSRCSRSAPNLHVTRCSSSAAFTPPRSSRSNGVLSGRTWAAVALAALLGGSLGFVLYAQPLKADAPPAAGQARRIRLKEVKKHGADCKDGIWVTRGSSVYDITEFVQSHPGGSVIMRAAGSAIEPYWSVFAFHARPDILEILDELKIGEVDPRDLVNGKVPADAIDDPFKDDPIRDPRLIQLTQKPCNAETPSESLQTFITPTETFFTRNHLWVPQTKPQEWELSIELPDGTTKAYSLADLRSRFKQHTITAVLQCSGNRRSHMTANSRPTNGLQWGVGAISNAEWSGVKLRDVLQDAGLPVDDTPDYARHVQFFGGEGYGASIPIHKACDPRGDVLLAFDMNGQPLPPDHGAPVRALVPGTVAARSVKFLSRISISEEESTSQWQRRDYKCFGPNVASSPKWEAACAIQELPVQSAITSIEEYSTHSEEERALLRNYGLEEDFVKITGYAFSGGGRAIQRVDVSTDGGGTWKQAKLVQDESKGSRKWSWTRWTHMVPKGYVGKEIVVKAVDDSYNTQPDTYESNWNFRGNLTSSWHRVPRPAFK